MYMYIVQTVTQNILVALHVYLDYIYVLFLQSLFAYFAQSLPSVYIVL